VGLRARPSGRVCQDRDPIIFNPPLANLHATPKPYATLVVATLSTSISLGTHHCRRLWSVFSRCPVSLVAALDACLLAVQGQSASMATLQQTITPMRQVPGAFLTTPAQAGQSDAVSRRLFRDVLSSTSTGDQTSTAPGSLGRPASGSSAPAGPGPNVLRSQALTATIRSDTTPSPLVKAALAINQVLDADSSYPDLDSYCRRE
jgi:hypothetical protein